MLREILLEANELMDKWQRTDFPKKQKWAERQLLLNESWAESRSSIFKAVLQSTFAVLEEVKCMRCMTENAIVKCHEYSPPKHLCHECDNHIQENFPFHHRDALVNRHFVPIPATTTQSTKGEWLISGK